MDDMDLINATNTMQRHQIAVFKELEKIRKSHADGQFICDFLLARGYLNQEPIANGVREAIKELRGDPEQTTVDVKEQIC